MRAAADYDLYPATAEDARELAATTRLGFESYRAWMPPGWLTPDHRLEILNIRGRLRAPHTWCLLARTAEPAGPAGAAGEGVGSASRGGAPARGVGLTPRVRRGGEPRAGEPAGHVALTPGTLREPPRRAVPGLAHLWMLFVRPAHWGTGLAGGLHDVALAEARSRGYERIQLHTPEGQARARAFYERRGWEREGPPFEDPMLALRIVRYVRPLDP